MSLLEIIEAEMNPDSAQETVDLIKSDRLKTSHDELLSGIRQGWPEGLRNSGLLSLGGLLRSRGLTKDVIEALLSSVNKSNGMNLSEKELGDITRSVSRYTPKPENRPCNVKEVLSVKEAGEKWFELRKTGASCKTGFKILDGSLPYFQAGEVFTIAGRSGTLKTTAGLQIGLGIAKNMSGNCLFVSLEMDSAAVFFRLTNIHLSENSNTPVTSGETINCLTERKFLQAEISRKYDNLLIVDKDNLSIEKIEEYLVVAREKYPSRSIPVVTIDYMGYIRDTQNGSNYEKVSRTAREIKGLAKRQQVRIILLCQTSREGKDGTEPVKLNHLRDSGAIEESADYVLGIWHSTEQTRLHCEILKARHSPRGARLDFINHGLFLKEEAFQKDAKHDSF
jgi:replicative DNA helicase